MATIREIALYAFLILFGWLSYLVLEPFLEYIILALLFAFLFHPIYRLLDKLLWSWLAASIVLIIVLLCIVIPSVYLAGTLIQQTTSAYQAVQASGISIFDESSIADTILHWTGLDVHEQVVELFGQGREAIKAAIPGIIASTGAFFLGLFLFFFVLYFALQDGPAWFRSAFNAFPFKDKHKEEIAEKLRRQANALLYGQILTSVLVGTIVGYLFWLFSVPNYIFWAFVATILGIIPVMGAFLVYIPGGIYLMWEGLWFNGIMVVVLSTVLHLVIDNILRPKLVSQASEIHPAIVILGALGGIAMMGMVGFLVGPLILSFFVTMLEID